MELHLTNLREIILVVGYQSQTKSKYAKNVGFSEPEARPWLGWQVWKDFGANLTEHHQFLFPGEGVVRVMEAKIV